MRKTNYKLLEAIRSRYGTQQEFALAVGCNESLISRVVNGYRKPSDELKQKFAEALQCDVVIFN
jgi:transcriptional regulator with XRE-family HTH domain